MTEPFRNVYDDPERARAYDALEFPGTYALAYRDLPALLAAHAPGPRAVDFGCGTGRSTRFLRGLGYDVVGVDVAARMLERARARDPEGDYRLVRDGEPTGLEEGTYDLVLSVFTFDNVPTREGKIRLFRGLRDLLRPGGRLVSVVSSADIYVHEWASFTTKDFPENRTARSGDRVRIVMLDVEDARPVEDVLWTDDAYRDVHAAAGLVPLAVHRPLGDPAEPCAWVSETTIAPWVIWILAPDEARASKETP